MRNGLRPGLIPVALVALAVLVSAHADTLQQTETARPLFVRSTTAGNRQAPDATVIRSRTVTIDMGALRDRNAPAEESGARPVLLLNLFDDTAWTARLDRVDSTRGQMTWVGHVPGHDFSTVTLAVADGAVAGSIVMLDAVYAIRPLGGQLHEITQVDQSKYPSELPPIPVPLRDELLESMRARRDPTAATDDGTTIDLLVLYTPAAAAAAGGTSGIAARINLGVSESNTSYINSNVNQRVRLVASQQIVHAESDDMAQDLYSLSNYNGTVLSTAIGNTAAALRDQYGADLTMLVTSPPKPNGCGIAWLMTSVSASWAPYGFSVVEQSCISPNLTFAHELGHNMGARHDWYVDGGLTPYTFAHGYVDAASRFRTVMAYNNLCSAQGFSCTRLPYWSNPYVAAPSPYAGVTMGIAGGTRSDCPTGSISMTACDADDHQALNSTAYSVANFRQSLAPVLPAVTLHPSPLSFKATKAGKGAPVVAVTPTQWVGVSITGASEPWTASSDVSWLQLSAAAGAGPGRFGVSVVNPSDAIGASTSLSATITVRPTAGSVVSASLPVRLTVVSPGSSTPPFGAFDTPADGATGLQGSFAVTGWALDDVGIDRVEIWRDRLPAENTPVYAGSGPGHGKIFVANPLFVEGSRPDVESAYAGMPFSDRAGWGYLLLSWGLWNQGNGTYTFYAFAYDKEGHVTTLGTRTVSVDNAHATKPFGAIDTPTYGGTVSASFWNYGWALTPNATSACTIQNGKVTMNIDSGPFVTVNFGDPRADIAAAFPGLSNAKGPGGAYYIDTTKLTAGVHQIGWLVYDSCNRGDGIGSRFFTVASAARPSSTGDGTEDAGKRDALAAHKSDPAGIAQLKALPAQPLGLRRIGGDWELVWPDRPDVRVIETPQDGRIELRLPAFSGGAYRAFQDVAGKKRALPLGSSFDAETGTYYWQPASGFLGTYTLVFVPDVHTESAIRVRVVVGPSTRAVVESPASESAVGAPFVVSGWALDLAAAEGSGIDTLHVWAYPVAGGRPVWLGVAEAGQPRLDVGQTYGASFSAGGYRLIVDSLPPGLYDLVVYPYRARTHEFEGAVLVRVQVR